MDKPVTQTAPPRQRTNGQKIWKRFFSRGIAVAGLILFILIMLLALLGDVFCPYDAGETVVRDRYQSPNAKHWLGTDDLGRDLLARIIDGARITLTISAGAMAIALVGGTLLGLVAGYVGKTVDVTVSGLMDSLWAFPAIILAMAINTALGTSVRNIVIAIGVVNIPGFYRIVRSRVLSIRETEYITGARAIGLKDGKIIFRYVLPNLNSTLIVQTTLCAAKAVVAEAGLSFLGLGVPLPRASWGTLLKNGFQIMDRAPWMAIFPGLAIMLLVMALNFVGDGLRDALDVRIRAD